MLNVLLISCLPPPTGGISTWTTLILRASRKTEVAFELVNTTTYPRTTLEGARISIGEAVRNLRILRDVARSLLRNHIDIVHLNATPTRLSIWRDWLILILCKLFRKPAVVQIHGDLCRYELEGWHPILMSVLKKQLRLSAKLLVLTRDSLEWSVRELPNTSATIVPNCIDIWHESHAELAQDGRKTILYVGALTAAKGVVELLEAASNHPTLDFLLVGSPTPDFQQPLNQFLEESPLENVKLAGACDNSEVRTLMRQAAAFCLPSYTEGFPMSILEAMEAGLPVIATDVGAIREMIDGDNGGILVPPGDSKALTNALREVLISGPRLAEMGDHNRRRAVELYSVTEVLSKLETVYRSAVAGE